MSCPKSVVEEKVGPARQREDVVVMAFLLGKVVGEKVKGEREEMWGVARREADRLNGRGNKTASPLGG